MSTHFDYLIVGGGMVADAAARGIREIDADGSIGILSEDVDGPYARPALSKKLWTDPDFTWEDADSRTAAETGADVRTRTTVTAIDPSSRTVTDARGESFDYGSLLLATGGRPHLLDLPEDPRVLYFRSANDYRRLRSIADEKPAVTVVGGGYIGTELAAALIQNGCAVSLVTPDDVVGASTFPASIAARIDAAFREHGVEILDGANVRSGAATADGIVLDLGDGRDHTAAVVVVGTGIDPEIALARDAGIETGDGIVVDEGLRTSAEGVYAAGDVAEYPDAILGRRRVEHVDNATEMGTTAGRILAGSDERYLHTPYYYSVLFGTRYEAVGTLDSELQTVEDPQGEDRSVVYYLSDDGVPVGVLLWNVPDDGSEELRDAARAVLSAGERATSEDLVGRIRID